MSGNESELIDLALAQNLISPKQAQMVRNELRMFGTAKAGASLLRHRYLTEEQIAALRSGVPGGAAPPPEAKAPPEPEPRPVAQPAAQAARPAPQPSAPQPGVAQAPPRSAEHPKNIPAAREETVEVVRPAEAPTEGGRNWNPLSAAVSAATKRGQGGHAAAPPPEPMADADTGIEIMPAKRRRGGAQPVAESAPAHAAAPPPQPAPPVVSAAAAPAVPTPAPPKRKDRSADLGRLKALLVNARNEGATDLHISPGRPPFLRRHGALEYPDMPTLTEAEAEDLCLSPLAAEQEARVREELQLDFSYEFAGGGRQRCNVYRQRLGWEGSFRLVPARVPTMDELGLPDAMTRLTEYHQGMILVTGPSGSGKTTTVAAMLQHINESRPDHIITLEDPVEYVFAPAKCHVTQREVGVHTKSFAQALRAALREDPDVILVGELRDVETISIAGSAAETGHLVFGTLHTGTAVRSVARIIDSYPPEQREQAASMISKSVRGVASQQLIPRKDGKGLALALEILIFTSAVAALVRDGKTHQLQSAMQGGKRSGMKLMDESLLELVQKGVISGREAWLRAENKQQFEAGKDR